MFKRLFRWVFGIYSEPLCNASPEFQLKAKIMQASMASGKNINSITIVRKNGERELVDVEYKEK